METVTRKQYTVLLSFLFFYMLCTTVSFAAYEVEPTSSVVATAIPQQAPTADVTVSWDDPTDNHATIIGYYTLWNTSNTPLTSTDFVNDNNTIKNVASVTFSTLTTSVFNGDDWDTLRYLHIQTIYSDATNPLLFSDDEIVVFNFDNVVSGTFRLPDPATPTSDLISTRDTTISVSIGVPSDLATGGIYLSETGTRPATGGNATMTSYTLADTTAGTKTITTWFEDAVGNISTPISASFDLLPSVSIDPATATIDLAVTSAKIFSMAGTSGGYNWSITQEKDEAGASATGTIATITTDQTTPPNSVTIEGLAKGTFALSATNDGGTTTIESGTITIALNSVTLTFSLQKNASTTSVNAISFALPVPGMVKASDFYAAIPNIDGLSRWDVTTQSYSSYVPGLSFTDFNLVLGEPYFVSVSTAGSYDMIAPIGSISFNLQKNASTTSVNAISLPYSNTTLLKASDLYSTVPNIDGLSRWDVTTQSYSSYVPGLSFTDFNLIKGEPYFVSVTATGTL